MKRILTSGDRITVIRNGPSTCDQCGAMTPQTFRLGILQYCHGCYVKAIEVGVV